MPAAHPRALRRPLDAGQPLHPSMKRQIAQSLLCLAVFAVPVQGALASAMPRCAGVTAIGLSMQERHAAIKAEAEAEAGMAARERARCTEASAREGRDMPVWHDAQPVGRTTEPPADTSHHVYRGAEYCHACVAEAASTTVLPELPPAALQHRRHALPLASATALADLPAC